MLNGKFMQIEHNQGTGEFIIFYEHNGMGREIYYITINFEEAKRVFKAMDELCAGLKREWY